MGALRFANKNCCAKFRHAIPPQTIREQSAEPMRSIGGQFFRKGWPTLFKHFSSHSKVRPFWKLGSSFLFGSKSLQSGLFNGLQLISIISLCRVTRTSACFCCLTSTRFHHPGFRDLHDTDSPCGIAVTPAKKSTGNRPPPWISAASKLSRWSEFCSTC